MTDAPARIHEAPSRVLVGVLGIDRDADNVDRVHESISRLSKRCRWDLLVVSREQDEIAQRKWSAKGAEIVTIPDYEIKKRHNLWRIADKRNLVCKRGLEGGYDAVMFVDGDVVFGDGTVDDLFRCAEIADVVVVPYKIRWSGEYTVGLIEDGKSNLVDARELTKKTPHPRIQGGSMGCTLIHSRALDVPFVPMQLGNVAAGEDIGFFYTLMTQRPELVVRTTNWPHMADHLID